MSDVSADDWRLANGRLIAFTAFYAVAAVAVAVLGVNLAGIAETLDDADPARQAGLALGAMLIGLLMIGSLLGMAIAGMFWWRVTARLGRAHGRPAAGHLGYWGAGVFLALLVAGNAVPRAVDDPEQGVLLQAAMRVIGAVVFIAGVLHTRAWFGARTPAAATPHDETGAVTAEDWDASVWDPEIQREIERRRRST